MSTRGLDLPEFTAYEPGKGNNYLLCIGIDAYQHWPKLQNAVKDARAFSETLCQQYQFEPEQVKSLYDEEATEQAIYQALREFKQLLTPQDNLVLYFSGHGHYDPDFKEGHWVPVDARRDNEGDFISNANILKRMDALEAHHILLVIDSCFSGSLLSNIRNAQVDEHFPSRRVFCSGRLEAVADGQAGAHSPFAKLLIDRLKRNTEAHINTTTLVQFVKDHISKTAQQTPVDGRLQNTQDQGGEFIFHLKVSEVGLWQRVKQEDQASAYENYLNYYPKGQYAAQARSRLMVLREDEVWQSTRRKDNELAYRNYLTKYAGTGKYLAQAEARLRELEHQQQERRKVLEKRSSQQAERERIQQQFQDHVSKAEALFQAERLEEAREQYRESLRYYMQGFAPTYDYLEQQINYCTNGITFLQYLKNGEAAMQNGNYRLAIQYLNEASKQGEDPKVEQLIRACQKKLKPGRQQRHPKQKQAGVTRSVSSATAPPKKRKSLFWAFAKWTAGITGLLFLLLIAIAVMYDEELSGSQPEVIPPTSNFGTTPSDGGSGYANKILGSWQVTEVIFNGQSSSEYDPFDYFSQLVYTFFDTGQVNIQSPTGTEQQTYSISGQNIYLYSAYWGGSPGVIEELGSRSMQLTFYVNNGYGGAQPLTIVFSRQ